MKKSNVEELKGRIETINRQIRYEQRLQSKYGKLSTEYQVSKQLEKGLLVELKKISEELKNSR